MLAVASAPLAIPVACVRAVLQEAAVVSLHVRVPSCLRKFSEGRVAAYSVASMPTLALEETTLPATSCTVPSN